MEDMRNMILSELIDKMHGRMADKMFPPEAPMPDVTKDDEPAAALIPESEAKKDEGSVDKDEDTITDEELDTMMKETA